MRHRERTDTVGGDAAAPPAGRVEEGAPERFDWWAAPARRGASEPSRTESLQPESSEPESSQPESPYGEPLQAEPPYGVQADSAEGGTPFADSPLTVAVAEWVSGLSVEPEPEPEEASGAAGPVQERYSSAPPTAAAEVYRHVQAGEEFQEIRREYRRFVFPACVAFLTWYLLYIVAAVTLPGLMGRQVAGPLNVAWLLGLLQFASTFLITVLYARHARDRRDRAALGLRWETQDRLR
ncbi:uncharacterized membrane protein (DUF485 family) [Streptacidiphilus sp. EB129]